MRPEIARPDDRDALGALGLAGETLAERLPGLMVDAERVAASVSQGAHGRRRPGQGEAFWQYRTYQHGDAAGAIDGMTGSADPEVRRLASEFAAEEAEHVDALDDWLAHLRSPSLAWIPGGSPRHV